MKHHPVQGAMLVILAAATVTSAIAGWPAVPLPENSRSELVSGHMNVNGVDMRAGKFLSPQPFEEVLDFYRSSWDPHVEDEINGTVVIGRAVDEDYYITVTLSSAGAHTEGLIGIVRVPDENEPPFEPGAGFDRPVGTEITSDISHHDLPNDARSLAMVNELSPFANRQYFLERLHSKGWRIVEAPDCLVSSWACMLRMEQRRNSRLTMTMVRGQDSRTNVTVLIES